MIDFIREHCRVPLYFLCRHFGASRSGFYVWKSSSEGIRFKSKKFICERIQCYFDLSKESYGSPRIYEDLRDEGIAVSENTVAKYMKEMGLDARLKKSFRVQTTDSNHSDPIAPRVFKAEEELPEGPGEVLAGDITYLRLCDGFLYLSVVLDLYNREVLGWSMKRSLEKSLVLDSLSMAMKKVGPDAAVIFHSDRGSQYASEAYRKMLKSHNAIPSMSRKGNCYDNAFVESWFASLKKERIYRIPYKTERELRALVFEYIEVWYNKKRRHSALGNKSPADYKANQADR